MDYLEIKQKLKYRNQELSNRLTSIKSDFDSNENLDDVLFSIAHETKVELAQVKQAIERIESNQYGTCKNCNATIDIDSLTNNPFQTLCCNCLEQN